MTQTITKKSLYESDFLLWTLEIAAKLKARDFEHLDIENLIEEIEDLGKSEKREVRSRLKVLLEHLLKRIYVDMFDCFNGWENTIDEQREEIKVELADSPSLKRFWDELFDVAWKLALRKVRSEHESKGFNFPDIWQGDRSIEALLNDKFWS
jgi:hypothetical protein